MMDKQNKDNAGFHSLRPYIELIDSFLNNQIDALIFEREYLVMFKNDTTRWSESEYDVLNNLFGDVDTFCADPELRDPEDLDEEQLRQQCRMALEKLNVLDNNKR